MSTERDSESGLHELEQKRQDRIPHTRQADERDVLVERNTNGNSYVAATDGQLVGPFKRGRELITKGESKLNGVLFPFTVMTNRRGSVEIASNTRFYYEDEDVHIRVKSARVDADGRIGVTLRETGACFPRRSWEFLTRDLARYIEDERLRSDKEVNERAEELLDIDREAEA